MLYIIIGKTVLCLEEKVTCRMVAVVLLLLLLSQTVAETHMEKCLLRNPQSPLHKYHRPGDILIGGIASQSFIMTDPIHFTELPPPAFYYQLR